MVGSYERRDEFWRHIYAMPLVICHEGHVQGMLYDLLTINADADNERRLHGFRQCHQLSRYRNQFCIIQTDSLASIQLGNALLIRQNHFSCYDDFFFHSVLRYLPDSIVVLMFFICLLTGSAILFSVDQWTWTGFASLLP